MIDLIGLAMVVGIFIFTLYLVRKIFYIVGFKDIPMLFSIVCFFFCVLSTLPISYPLLDLLICLVLQVAQVYLDLDEDKEIPDITFNHYDFVRFFDNIKNMFFFLTLVLDLYKW